MCVHGDALQYCDTIYAACLFQVQGHAGLRALVLPGTMVESVVPNLLRIVPVLLQCRGDASLSMVSITFIGLAREGRTFEPDVIHLKYTSISRTPARFPYFVFRYRAHYSPLPAMNRSRLYLSLFFFYFLLCNLYPLRESIRLQFGVNLNIKNDIHRVNRSRDR